MKSSMQIRTRSDASSGGREPMVLAHVVWMDRYAGDTDSLWRANWNFDQAGHKDERSGERYLFTPVAGKYLGYVPRFTENEEFKSLSLETIDPLGKGDSYTPVTVVWTATPPD